MEEKTLKLPTVEQMAEWIRKALDEYAAHRITHLAALHAAERVIRQMEGKPVDRCGECRGIGVKDGKLCSGCGGEKYVFLAQRKKEDE